MSSCSSLDTVNRNMNQEMPNKVSKKYFRHFQNALLWLPAILCSLWSQSYSRTSQQTFCNNKMTRSHFTPNRWSERNCKPIFLPSAYPKHKMKKETTQIWRKACVSHKDPSLLWKLQLLSAGSCWSLSIAVFLFHPHPLQWLHFSGYFLVMHLAL